MQDSQQIKAVIFDLDGTLVHTMADLPDRLQAKTR
jgi:beta-phosphoglucomutase-like phosphatase (HAD superfamily)